ncbi:hypothetical protein [Actinoplanes sp. M2I2]|uniref:hypothetical protein n=1 Tax=Actinoplanes sp. M2I2 TaxID=1734444 RepID=UPI002020E2DC|nr:hypothetical protein [Actinoplanes sp. M2I2]
MTYDTNNENYPHLRLSDPSLRALAAAMTVLPSEQMRQSIEAAAQAMPRSGDDGKVDPYWLYYEIRQIHPEVTIDQVAWVLLALLESPQQ